MSDESLVGQILGGKYRVDRILGKGGMGLVVGARHLKLDEPVAIKILRHDVIEVQGMEARFLREARAASRIKNPHVAHVTDVDTLEDGTPYMVMEYLEGIDFSDLRKERGTFEVSEAVDYLLEACEAVAEAHALGIVHRDLKPSNLFLAKRRDGREIVKVLDFGISKLASEGEGDTTQTGTMLGSPKYMSPEQMLSMSNVDGRSDIWSLATMLYEFLTGRAPFVAETTPRICALVLAADPAPPRTLRPDLPKELEDIILRCLQKEPDKRYANVTDFARALIPFASGPPEEAPRSGFNRSLRDPNDNLLGADQSPRTPALSWNSETRIDRPPTGQAPSRRRLAIAGAAGVIALALLTIFITQKRPGAPLSDGATSGPTKGAATGAHASIAGTALPPVGESEAPAARAAPTRDSPPNANSSGVAARPSSSAPVGRVSVARGAPSLAPTGETSPFAPVPKSIPTATPVPSGTMAKKTDDPFQRSRW